MSYGYKTILELDGEVIDVVVFSYSFDKEIDENGDVTSRPLGGNIYLSLMDIPKNNILSWGINHRVYKSGRIRVIGNDEQPVIAEDVDFERAACVNMKISYERDNTDYFTTLLTISAENICVGQSNCWVNKNWT
jgi:xanthine dehydrogenase molybdopterin-binding subunit B